MLCFPTPCRPKAPCWQFFVSLEVIDNSSNKLISSRPLHSGWRCCLGKPLSLWGLRLARPQLLPLGRVVAELSLWAALTSLSTPVCVGHKTPAEVGVPLRSAMEEGLISRGGRNLRLPLCFGLRHQGPCRVGTGESGYIFSEEWTPLASRVVHGVSGPLSKCVWNLQVFPDDARRCQ